MGTENAVGSGGVGKDSIDRYFGLAIAYLMPGLVALFGLSYRITELRTWFGFVASHETTVAGFLFVMVASIGMGVMLSAARCFVLERVTGLARAKTGDLAKRSSVEPAYQALIADHYNYYKCYGNMAVAVVVFAVCYGWTNAGGLSVGDWILSILATLASVALLTWAALDAIRRFEDKRGNLLGWERRA